MNAVSRNRSELVDLLLQDKRVKNSSLATIFWYAVKLNYTNIMQIFIDHGINYFSAIFEPTKDTAIYHALSTNSWTTIRLLLDSTRLDPKSKYAIIGWIAVNAPHALESVIDQIRLQPPKYPHV
jgi:hypothetical protein